MREEMLRPPLKGMSNLASSIDEEYTIGISAMMVGNLKVMHCAMELLAVPKIIMAPLACGKRGGTPLGVHPKHLVGNDCRSTYTALPRILFTKLGKSRGVKTDCKILYPSSVGIATWCRLMTSRCRYHFLWTIGGGRDLWVNHNWRDLIKKINIRERSIPLQDKGSLQRHITGWWGEIPGSDHDEGEDFLWSVEESCNSFFKEEMLSNYGTEP